MQSPKILFLSGSIRSGSVNNQLAALAAKHAVLANVEVTMISLGDYPLPIYDRDYELSRGVPESATKLAELIRQQHAVYIASPEYNGSLTPLLKNAIDWVSRVKSENGSPFKNKIFAIGAAAPGGLGGIRALGHLRDVLMSVGGLVLTEQVSVPGASSAFDEKGDLTNERSAGLLSAQIARLVSVSKSLG